MSEMPLLQAHSFSFHIGLSCILIAFVLLLVDQNHLMEEPVPIVFLSWQKIPLLLVGTRF